MRQSSPAINRFRSIARFVQGTVLLSKTYNGASRLFFDTAVDASLLTMNPVGNPSDPPVEGKQSLVASNLVAQFTQSIAQHRHHEGDQTQLTDQEIIRIERKALDLFEQASYISVHKRLAIAISVIAFFNEFALAGMEEPNFAQAERLYNQAATLNCTFAQARLAFLKMHGRPNIKINQATAEQYKTQLTNLSKSFTLEESRIKSTSLSWLHILAVNHHPAAQFCLGLCHYNGIGAPKQNVSTYIWCHRAAIQNHAGAMNMLGNLYTEGHGTTKTPGTGLRWYIRAAERKDAAAIYNIGTLFERGIAVEEDSRQAFEWYIRASVFGSVNAQNVLGIFYEQGVGVAQNPEKAVQYYKLAAGNGHPHAMYNLARCYHDGFGVPRDDSVALMWFKMGSEQGHLLSILSVAVCFDAGIGVHGERSGTASRRHYWNASKKGSAEAKNRLTEVVALELLVAARPLLAGRILSRTEHEKLVAQNKRASLLAKRELNLQQLSLSSLTASPIPPSPPRYYDDATEELLHRLGLTYDYTSPSRSINIPPASYYANKTTQEIMFPITSPPRNTAQFDREMTRASKTINSFISSESDDMDFDWVSCSSDSDASDSDDSFVSRVAEPTSIAALPTEIIVLILSYLNDQNLLSTEQVLRILRIAGNRGSLGSGVTKRAMMESFGIQRVAVWIDDKNWCGVCREGRKCDKIKHHINKLANRVDLTRQH